MNTLKNRLRGSLRTSIAAVAVTLVTLTAHAQAQFAPTLSDDIEGAIMPAIPFPSNEPRSAPADGNYRVPMLNPSAPASLGLSPTEEPEAASVLPVTLEPKPRPLTRRGMSAQDIADRLLNR